MTTLEQIEALTGKLVSTSIHFGYARDGRIASYVDDDGCGIAFVADDEASALKGLLEYAQQLASEKAATRNTKAAA